MDAQAFINQAGEPGCLLTWEESVRLSCDDVVDHIDRLKGDLDALIVLCAMQDGLIRTMVTVNKKLLDHIDELRGRE